MNDELMAALDDCLNALAVGFGASAGASAEALNACLARYPALAEDLRPLLEAGVKARGWGDSVVVPRRAEVSSRARFLARAAELRAPVRSARPGLLSRWPFVTRALTTGLAFALGILVGTYGVLIASAQSLPGDQLYGLKRAAEQTQLLLSSDPQSQKNLQAQFTKRRVQEVQQVTSLGRAVPVEFSGPVESIDGERWIVAGVAVIAAPDTAIEGAPAVGAPVQVHGMSQADGAVLASAIQVEMEAEISLPATPTPTPTSTLNPTRTSTSVPLLTSSPQPSSTPGPGGGSGPSPSNTPKPEDDDDETPEPSHTPGAGGGPSPSNTPKPEDDDETPEASHTPGAGGGPSPSNTPRPEDEDETPEPSHTPHSSGGSGLSPSNTPKPEDND